MMGKTTPAIILTLALIASAVAVAPKGEEVLHREILWMRMGMVQDHGNPGDFDSVHADWASVIFDEGIYKVWYSGFDGTNWRIMYSTSPDGFIWAKHGVVVELGAPGELDDQCAMASRVLRNNQGTYEMWYVGQSSISWGWRILHATSDDGVDWLKRGLAFSKSGKSVSHPFVFIDNNGIYRMWYNEYDGEHWRIGYATSNDGISWNDEGVILDVGLPGEPDSKFIYHPSVMIEPDGTYIMLYSAYDGNPSQTLDIRYATSPDGMGASWTKMGVSLEHGRPGDYDSIQAIPTTIRMRQNGLHELWYSGFDGIHRRIMLALGMEEVPINLTASVVNNKDIELNWTIPESLWLHHYLVYRSPDQRSFDFSNWLHNTSDDPNPLETSWVDVDAAAADSSTEYYYVVRAVYSYGLVGTTSNTVGKWTKTFSPGFNTFSPPLEPFEIHNLSWYVEDIPNTTFIRWMNSTGHWVTHSEGTIEGVDDAPIEMGRGYEIFLTSETRYTFCGYPASMIRYREGLGDSVNFRKSLSVEKEGTDLMLSWSPIGGASEYRIFKSDQRNGLHHFALQPTEVVPATQSEWIDLDALANAGEYHYMVIPVDSTGNLRSSTYSVGVVTIEYQSGSDTFALPLKTEVQSLDWYCENIPNTVGMAYMTSSIWRLHVKAMPEGVYDVEALQSDGYQISQDGESTRFIFIGY